MATDYGADVSTFVVNDEGEPDLDPNFTEIEGSLGLVERVARRWSMERGELFYDEEAGEDVRNRVNAKMTDDARWRMQTGLEDEARKEDGVRDCQVFIESPTSDDLNIYAAIFPFVGAPLAFVFDATKLTITNLREGLPQ